MGVGAVVMGWLFIYLGVVVVKFRGLVRSFDFVTDGDNALLLNGVEGEEAFDRGYGTDVDGRWLSSCLLQELTGVVDGGGEVGPACGC